MLKQIIQTVLMVTVGFFVISVLALMVYLLGIIYVISNPAKRAAIRTYIISQVK